MLITNKRMRDIDLTVKQLEQKYGRLDYIEKAGNLVDSSGRVRRINHTRANNDFMREMEAGILFQSLYDDFNLTLKGLEQKYGTLRLTPEDYYVDSKGIIRRILPYTPLTR
jgi:hypothetical protein